MTLVDAMTLAAGVALSLQARPIVGGYPYVVPEPRVLLMIAAAWCFWIGSTATSVAVAARLVRYRRGPRPAEWLAILMALAGIQAMGPLQPIDTLTRWLPPGLVAPLDTFSGWRWTTAGLASVLVVAGLGLLRLVRGFLPPWARTAALTSLAYLTLAGPISTIGMNGADLLAPPMGFGPGSLSMLYWLSCQLIATTPFGVMIGVPVVAALIERAQRVRWRWTEWASVLASILIALALSPLYTGNFSFPSIGWVAERGLVGAWLVGVGLLSWVIRFCLGPAWSRWLGDQAEVPGSTDPIGTSPASTRPT